MEQFFSRERLKQVGTVLLHAIKHFSKDNGPQWAAAIAYYTLLSMFPLLLAAIAIAAYFVDREWAIEQASQLVRGLIPSGTRFIRDIVQEIIQTRGEVSVFSILVLLWSGSRVFGVITKALNISYNVSEPYSFFKRTIIELSMMFTIGILFALALGSRLLVSFLEEVIRIPLLQQDVLFHILGYAIPAILLLISLFLTYQYVPRRRVTWWAALIGSIVFTVLFLIAQPLFIGYIRTFANYSLVYGPLAILVTMVFWTWIVANLLLFGVKSFLIFKT